MHCSRLILYFTKSGFSFITILYLTDDGKMVITGRRGTMKRKRQLRSALEHIDDDYSDDVFESTPMKKRMKRVKVNNIIIMTCV